MDEETKSPCTPVEEAGIIEKLLRARESLLGRIYVPGSIKHYELVEG